MTDQAQGPASPFHAINALNVAGKPFTLTISLRAGRTITKAELVAGDDNWLLIRRTDGTKTYEAVSNIRRIAIIES